MTYQEAKRKLDEACPSKERSASDRQLIRELMDWMLDG